MTKVLKSNSTRVSFWKPKWCSSEGLLIGLGGAAARVYGPPWLRRPVAVYVEAIRNVPLLLQIIFWYNVVLGNLPNPKQAAPFLDIAYLSNLSTTGPTAPRNAARTGGVNAP